MRPADAADLLLAAAEALERDGYMSESLRTFTVGALRAVAAGRPLPGVQDPRGRQTALDPFEVFRELIQCMQERGGPEHFHRAVEQIAARHEVDEKTVRRTLRRLQVPNNPVLELELLALHQRTK